MTALFVGYVFEFAYAGSGSDKSYKGSIGIWVPVVENTSIRVFGSTYIIEPR